MKWMPEKKKHKPGKIIRYNLKMLGKIAKHSPALVPAMIIKSIFYGLASSLPTVFAYKILNGLDSGLEFNKMLVMTAWMLAFYIVHFLITRCYNLYFSPWMNQKLHYGMHDEIFRKAEEADLACYDDPVFYNDFVWAMDESDARAIKVINSLESMISDIVYSATVIALVVNVSPLVAGILFIHSIFRVFMRTWSNKISVKSSEEYNPVIRKTEYVNRIFHLADYAKEIRTSRVSENMFDLYDKAIDKEVEISLRYGKKWVLIWGLIDNLFRNIVYYGILIFMFLKLCSGSILIGEFAATVNCIWSISWALTSLMDDLTGFQENSLYIEKYIKFMSYESKIKHGGIAAPKMESIEFKNVSFRYKPEGDYILKNVSITLHKGEKIALVGYNGAGKTTLIKLLLRLYDPTEGEILMNGVDIKKYEVSSYRARLAAVFQDYKIFAASIAENVLGGRYTEADREKVLLALHAASFDEKLETLPDGIQTQLTREFDDNGTNLSGGEAQKIAIARAFARDSDVIVMDEPSSALDPVSEYNLNHSVAEYSKDKTVVYISHRLSTTRMADEIYMFDNGVIIEQGSHDELMQKNGRYAEMFELQASKYSTVQHDAETKKQFTAVKEKELATA